MSHTISGFVLLLFWCTLISSEVRWVRRTDPILFGENVVLFCYLPDNFDISRPRQWKTRNTVLTIDEGPTDRNKYEGSLEKNGFTLTIKTFQVEDFGRNYTCAYGFDDYMANLTTDNYQWIPQPGTYKVDVWNSTIKMIKFTLRFQQVYPKPSCISLIGHKAIPAEFTISLHMVDKFFLATNLTLEYHYDTFDCGEEVSILCNIGDKTLTVNISTHRQCADVCQRFSPCLNNGTCGSNKSSIGCDCTYGFNGERCEDSESTTKQVLSTTVADTQLASASVTTGIGVAVGIICLITVSVAYIVYRRRRGNSQKSTHKPETAPMNGYGVPEDSNNTDI